MLRVQLLCVGKLKEAYWTQACQEYIKRLSGLCKLRLEQLPAAALPREPSAQQINAALEAEGKRFLEKIPTQCRLYATCVEGMQLSSEQFSADLAYCAQHAQGQAVFVIGSSHGLSPAVKERADLRLSFSSMTLPHQLARVVLLEQLYRALQIQGGTRYHK